MKKPFKFKQFSINQDRCAMKIGTDGVLLGAWVSLEQQPNSILDIGSGTGLIALMLAQRSASETIDALEIDDDAFEQCVANFEASQWADRLFCYHAPLDEFVSELLADEAGLNEAYDLIVSNPPFYSEAVSSGDASRDVARQNESLPFEELLDGVSQLLNKQGVFATIIPFKEEEEFIRLAAQKKLFPKRITRVKGNPSSETKRSLMEFQFVKSEVTTDALTIEVARHEYTPEYIQLTKNFYLKM